jgi:tripartite-type tricarboxylate transporter receptor subunit TctC
MPDVPTIAETVPGYEVQLWNGMEAPAGTPKPIITRLNTALNKALGTADIKDRLTKAGVDVDPQSPEEMAAYIDGEIKKWTKVTREAGIKAED